MIDVDTYYTLMMDNIDEVTNKRMEALESIEKDKRRVAREYNKKVRDMGTRGSPPTRVPGVPLKWTRPARSPADLQVGLETLSTTPVTLDDYKRPYPDTGGSVRLVAQDSFAGRGSVLPVGPQIA
jgi:hypothetical protein